MTFATGPHPRAFAHRGWHIDELAGCENSLAAFRRAVDEGFRYLETDVHVSADGIVVAFHDSVLDRVTDLRGPVAHRSYRELRAARIGGREQIPTLGEVLATCPEALLNIDPKSDAVVGPLIDLLYEMDAWSRVCIGSFSDARLATIRAAAPPGTATSLGPRRVLRLVANAMTRGGPATSPAFAAQLPTSYRRIPIVTSRLVTAARHRGLEVHVWTIDDPSEMHRLLDLGVDGLMTDRPDLLRAVLRDRGQWQ